MQLINTFYGSCQRVVLAVLCCMVISSCVGAPPKNTLRFIVERNYDKRSASENVLIVMSWKDIEKRLPGLSKSNVVITDLNFGKQISGSWIDSNKDKKPDQLVFEYTFLSNEPIFSFSLTTNGTYTKEYTHDTVAIDERLQITYLTSSKDFKKNNVISNWSDKIISSTLTFYPDPVSIARYAPERWNYEYGYFLNATFLRWKNTQNPAYLAYIKKWADHFVDDEGKLDPKHYKVDEYKLDDILPGRLLISLHEVTQEEKYKLAAMQLRNHLRNQPKTSDGGYWHKQIYPFQMWLDGIYMADIFSTHYAHVYDEPELMDEAIHQIKLIARHTTDPVTGLMYHGWDESKNKVWANPETGTSPSFWGRSWLVHHGVGRVLTVYSSRSPST